MSRKWDESEHPRWPAGSPGDVDGQFRPKAGGKRDLASLSRSTLLKYARERGLVLPRGTDDDTIRQMIRRFDSGAEPEWVQRAGDRLAKKAPAKKFDAAEVAGRVSNARTERAVIELLASDPTLTAARLRKVAEYLGFEIPDDVKAKTSLQMLIAEEEARERKLPGGYEKTAKRTPGKEPPVTVGVAFNSRKHPEGTRVVWAASDGETVYGTVGRMGRFTTIDWGGGKREKVRAGVNHDDIRVVSDDERMEQARVRLGTEDPTKKVAAAAARIPKLEAKVENLRSRLDLARDKRRAKKGDAGRFRGPAETKLELQLMDAKNELARAREAAIPPFVEPERPDSSSDPQVLYQQAIDYADEMNAMMFGDRPRFMERPPLDALQGLQRGVDPKEVVAQLYREAEINPEEWGGSREYLNRLAGFLSLQSSTLPKAEADRRKAARARWTGVFEAALGKEYWRGSTSSGREAPSRALTDLAAGRSPTEVARDMRASAQHLENRAHNHDIMDYELDTLSHSVADRKAAGLADAKRLRRLADAIQEAGRRR